MSLIKNQVEYFSSKGCIGQKNEIVASPSFIPMYKGKTEEQILYEYLKEKRPKPNADRLSAQQNSILERERPGLSSSSSEEPKGSIGEQRGLESRNLGQSASKIEQRRQDILDDDLIDKKDNVVRTTMSNRDAPAERKAEEEKPKANEDSKQKKNSNLLQKLSERKKVLAESALQKSNGEVKADPVLRDEPHPSKLEESRKVNLEEGSRGPEDIPKKKDSGVLSMIKKEQRGNEVSEKEFDPLTASFTSEAFERENHLNARYLEDSRTLMSQVTDPSKQNAPEKKVVEERRDAKVNKVSESEGPRIINVEERGLLQSNNKPSDLHQERPNRDSDSSGSQPASGYQKLKMTGQEDDDMLSQGSSNRRKKVVEESEPQERREELEYLTMSRVSETKSGNETPWIKESQASRSSRQREVEEIDFYESEREPLVKHHEDQMRESRDSMRQSKAQSGFMGQKDSQYLEKRISESREEPESGKVGKSETSLAEINERKIQKSEKGEGRSVLSYVKNTEQLVKLLLAKIERLEENQGEMIQIMKRQEQKIKDLQSHLGVEGDDDDQE